MRVEYLIVFSFISLISCSEEKDNQFCRCMEINKKFTEKLSKSRNKKESESLYREKMKVCEPYHTMGGKELKKLQKECKN